MPSASSQKQIPLRHCVIPSPSHSKVQSSSMYSDVPSFQSIHHHHQQPQSLGPPLQVATSLWPPQTSNYWFPNWRELFHGFIVVPSSSQPRHATVSSFAQNQAEAPYPPSTSCTRYMHLGSDDPTQSAHLGARSAQHQQITSPIPSSNTHSPLSCFPEVTRLPSRPSGTESLTAAQLPTPVDQSQKRDEHVVCPLSSQALGPITKYTIKSPFWLPQGWVTEMRMRSTGTTADKFYKHLASGRRFRSRNEVFHFIHTGKGRTRKHNRRKKSLNLSLMNNFAHKKQTSFTASKPAVPSSQSLSSSSSENRHPVHVGNPLLTEPTAELGPNGESGAPSKQPICFSASSSIQEPESSQLQLKRPAQDDAQELLVEKKQKTLPLKAGVDKQTSKVWQRFKVTDTEAKASEMVEQRNENDLSCSKDTASPKTEQLGREIQAAHKTVVQMSKEMQATVDKLSREIRQAQKDVELSGDLKLSRVPAVEAQVASIYRDVGGICSNNQAPARECMMSTGVVQALHWLPRATSTQSGQPESGFVPQYFPKQDNVKGFPKQDDPRLSVSPQVTNFVSNASTAERSYVVGSMSQAIQPAIWPDIALHQVVRMDYGSHAAKRHVDTSNQATQPVETAFVTTTVLGTQAALSHGAAPIHVTQATLGNATLPTLWPGFAALNLAQPTQIADTMHAKAAGKCGVVESHLPECAENAHIEAGIRAQTPQKNSDMGGHQAAKQPAQVDCVGIVNAAQAVRTHLAAPGSLLPTTERPVYSIGNANASLYNPVPGNVMPLRAGDGSSEQWLRVAAQVGVPCEVGTTEEEGRQKYQDRKEIIVRKNKFAAVLNPKLDLSRLNPALTARQKAKVVQRMKTRHARDLLATLGLHLCRKALRPKPWLPPTRSDQI